jgi:hypothetical protein
MIHLPTSIGEAVDKLTILDIKCKRISDPERLVFCKQEYELLHSKLDSIVSNFQFYYDKLYEVNDLIWIMQDEIRSMKTPSGEKCIEIINMNDIRFRIKDYIKGNIFLEEDCMQLFNYLFIFYRLSVDLLLS